MRKLDIPHHLLRYCAAGVGCAAFNLPSTVWAQTPQQTSVAAIFSPADKDDWASALLDFLFSNGELPVALSAYSTRLAPVADILRQALSAYCTAMLVFAGLLLLYHLVSFVLDTAHEGVALGRKTNQVWAPIRLVVAILLLVPVGNMSGGQYIVIKIAKVGSSLANHAWSTMTSITGSAFSTLVTPHQPSVTTLVTRAVEIELCHIIYDSLFTSHPPTPTLQFIGNISSVTKTMSSPLAPESWRYTNNINPNTPICGEYRFSGYRAHALIPTPYTDNIARIADDLSSFSRAQAESLMAQAHGLAVRSAPLFTEKDPPMNVEIKDEIASISRTLSTDIASHLRNASAINKSIAEKLVTQPAEIGWVAAGFMLPALVHVQESYGELVDHILPDIKAPIFNHPFLARQVLEETIATHPSMVTLDGDVQTSMLKFYAAISQNMERAHNWLYTSQIPDDAHVLISEFDIRQQLGASTQSQEANTLITNALDKAGIAYGVWGQNPEDSDAGNPFEPPNRARTHNPISGMIEFGHRQISLGTYLMGMGGSLFSLAHIAMPALLTSSIAALFLIGGTILMFLVPILPFFRFTAAILAWLLEIFEALAAIPLVALAHLSPSGHGLSGATARQAYRLWFGIAVRPILTLFGLVLGLVLFTLGLSLLEIGLIFMARLSSATNTGSFIIANCGTVLLYDLLVLAIANIAFRGIHDLPNLALRWITPLVTSDAADTGNQVPNNAPASGASPALQSINTLSQIANMVRQAATNAPPSSPSPSGEYGMKTMPLPRQNDGTHGDKMGNFNATTNNNLAALSNTSTNGSTSTSSSTTSTQSTNVQSNAAKDKTKNDSKPQNDRTEPYANAPFHHDKTKSND